MAKDCPDKPAQMCRNCGEEGHVGQNCPNARKLDHTGTVDLPADDAWAKMIDAAKEKDLEDFREGMKSYTKAVPEVTYRQIEEALRNDESNVFLIAFVSIPRFSIELADLGRSRKSARRRRLSIYRASRVVSMS